MIGQWDPGARTVLQVIRSAFEARVSIHPVEDLLRLRTDFYPIRRSDRGPAFTRLCGALGPSASAEDSLRSVTFAASAIVEAQWTVHRRHQDASSRSSPRNPSCHSESRLTCSLHMNATDSGCCHAAARCWLAVRTASPDRSAGHMSEERSRVADRCKVTSPASRRKANHPGGADGSSRNPLRATRTDMNRRPRSLNRISQPHPSGSGSRGPSGCRGGYVSPQRCHRSR